MTLARQNAVTDDITVTTETVETAQSTEPMPASWPSVEGMLDDVLKLADKLEACEKTKNERRQQLRRVAEHVADDLDELTALTVLSAESIKEYCQSCAPHSVDTYCKMALAFHRHIASAQGHTDLPVPVCREMAAIESVMADFEHERRTTTRVCLGLELVALIKCPLGRCGINTPTSVTVTSQVSQMMSAGRGNISERRQIGFHTLIER